MAVAAKFRREILSDLGNHRSERTEKEYDYGLSLRKASYGRQMKNIATPQEVLNRHLDLSRSQSERDFLECYREGSFLVMRSGVRRGIEGIRACYRQLNQELPNACYTYNVIIVEQDVAFVEWSADSDTHTVADGVDSYVIEKGYIRAQTIHDTLVAKNRG